MFLGTSGDVKHIRHDNGNAGMTNAGAAVKLVAVLSYFVLGCLVCDLCFSWLTLMHKVKGSSTSLQSALALQQQIHISIAGDDMPILLSS